MPNLTGIFSTEDINSYGFWVSTKGIELARFKKNPIILNNHSSWGLPVGRVENIRIEKGELKGELIFDDSDEKGKQLKSKYEKGFMNAFSIGFEVVEMSNEPSHLKVGQSRETVTKCELIEISVVTIPSNANAVRLYKKGNLLELSNNLQLNNYLPKLKNLNIKKIALKLGLNEEASSEKIIEAIIALQKTEPDKSVEYRKAIIKLGERTGLITEDNKEAVGNLLKLDINSTIKLLSGINKKTEKIDVTSLAELLQGKAKTVPETQKKFNELSHQELSTLKEKDIEKYRKLYLEHYGIVCPV